jgi:hypothetical protein
MNHGGLSTMQTPRSPNNRNLILLTGYKGQEEALSARVLPGIRQRRACSSSATATHKAITPSPSWRITPRQSPSCGPRRSSHSVRPEATAERHSSLSAWLIAQVVATAVAQNRRQVRRLGQATPISCLPRSRPALLLISLVFAKQHSFLQKGCNHANQVIGTSPTIFGRSAPSQR